MTAGARQHVVGMVAVSSGRGEREEAEDRRRLTPSLRPAFSSCTAAPAAPGLLFPPRGRGGLRAADQSESGARRGRGGGGARDPARAERGAAAATPTRVRRPHRGAHEAVLLLQADAGDAAAKSHGEETRAPGLGGKKENPAGF